MSDYTNKFYGAEAAQTKSERLRGLASGAGVRLTVPVVLVNLRAAIEH